MKAIILARVSTEEQKEAGNSLPAQIERLESYCKRKGYKIVKTFSFDESAYGTSRNEFDSILEYVKLTKEKLVVCFDKVDRFSRNVFDKRVSVLYELAMKDEIELHFASDNLAITSNISATEKFHFGINLNLAKYYSDAISDNVKRAYEQKLRKGEWIGSARIGYINIVIDDGTKDIVPDPERAHFIPKIFEYYIAGTSIKLLSQRLKKEGLRTKNNKPLSSSMVHKILKDQFYYGVMVVKGKEYPHKYQPLISYNLFLKAQEVRKSWKKKPFQFAAKPFIFRGLIKCSTCGCMITPEFKKGKYILYSCTNYKRTHQKRIYVSEKDLLEPVYNVLQSLKLPQNQIDGLVKGLKASSEAKTLYHENAIKALDRQYLESVTRADKLLDLLLASSITQDIYDTKFKKEKELQADILIQKEEHTNADTEYHITASTVLNLAKRALEIFKSSEIEEKRQFLGFLLQNCQLYGKKLEFTLRNPFDLIAKYSSLASVLPN